MENKNRLESMIFQAEKLLSENEEKVSEELKEALEQEISTSKGALESDAGEIESRIDSLSLAMQEVGKSLYENASPPDSDIPPASPQDDEDILDAEFTEAS